VTNVRTVRRTVRYYTSSPARTSLARTCSPVGIPAGKGRVAQWAAQWAIQSNTRESSHLATSFHPSSHRFAKDQTVSIFLPPTHTWGLNSDYKQLGSETYGLREHVTVACAKTVLIPRCTRVTVSDVVVQRSHTTWVSIHSFASGWATGDLMLTCCMWSVSPLRPWPACLASSQRPAPSTSDARQFVVWAVQVG